MSLTCRSVTFIVIACDLCRITEHRAHEARQDGDMGEFLRANEARAVESLPVGWAITKGTRKDADARRYVCPNCAKEIRSA